MAEHKAPPVNRALECGVCYEVFNSKSRRPKNLGCGHTVCSRCAGQIVSHGTLTCPICQQDTPVPSCDVTDLPTAFVVLSITETLCEECASFPRDEKCAYCDQVVCKACFTLHSKVSKNLKAVKAEVEDVELLYGQDDLNYAGYLDRPHKELTEIIQREYQELLAKLNKEKQDRLRRVNETFVKEKSELMDWKQDLDDGVSSVIKFLASTSCPKSDDVSDDNTAETDAIAQVFMSQLREKRNSKPQLSEKTYTLAEISKGQLMGKLAIKARKESESSVTSRLRDEPASYPAQTSKELASKFKRLTGIAVSPVSGNVVVCDSDLHKIHILTPTLAPILTFGRQGSGPGEFNYPFDVAINVDDKIFVSDQVNNRIQVTDSRGKFLYMFGTQGYGRGHIGCPLGLTFDAAGLLYVCDSTKYRIQVMQQDGTYVRVIGGPGDDLGRFASSPIYIAMLPSGLLAITEQSGNLHLFIGKGKPVRMDKFLHAKGVTATSDGHLVVSNKSGRLLMLTEAGKRVCEIGEPGSGPGQLDKPWGVAVTPDGHIAVADSGNSRVQIFQVPSG